MNEWNNAVGVRSNQQIGRESISGGYTYNKLFKWMETYDLANLPKLVKKKKKKKKKNK